MSENASHLRHVVTAVLVAHDGARLLPGLIKAVQEQTRPVDRAVGVDTGSRDRSAATLTGFLGPDAVVVMNPDTGYGAAITGALRQLATLRPPSGSAPGRDVPDSDHGLPASEQDLLPGSERDLPGSERDLPGSDQDLPGSALGRSASDPDLPGSEQDLPGSERDRSASDPDLPGSERDLLVEWIWLLHDDCEPAADALEQMLSVASRESSTAVLGPKLRDLADRRVLREAGVTADRAGRRVTGIEPGEIDQGQHDGNRPVLAVSSAGMLIRRDVWDRVGGFDRNLPLFRDDFDFCWRVHAAGYDVQVITDSVVYHRELSARQIRDIPAAGGHPRLLDRRSALYVFAVDLPLVPMLAVVAGCAAGSLLRAAYFVSTKQPRKAWDHLGAVAWLLGHPTMLWHARRRRAADRKHGWTVLRGQLPRGKTLARLAETSAGLLARRPGHEGGGLHHAVIDESDDDMPLPAPDSVVRRVLTSPGVLLCGGLALIALTAERSLVGSVLTGSGTLGGGALVPAWGGAGDLWREYLAGYHDAGLGSAASAPPYLGVVAALATMLAGKPWLATDVLLFGCVPAAGVTAFLATRRITSVLAARLWAAVTYALLPVAMGAVAAGRVGTAVAYVLLPPIGTAIGRMLAGPPPAARRAAWAAGLLIAVAAAFVPLLWPIAVAAALGVIAAWPWLGRAAAVNAAIVALVPAVVLIPWTFRLLTSPSALFLEAGVQRPGLASPGLRPESVLLLSPGGPGLPPPWVTAGLVVPAFCALLARRRIALVQAGWGIALVGLTIALVVSRVRVTPPQGGPVLSVWPGIAFAIAAAGLLLAATPLVEAAARALGRTGDLAEGRRPGTSWRVLAVLGGLAVAASAPVLAAGYWLTAGVRGPVTAAGPEILPAFVSASSSGPDRNRTLVLRRDGGVLSYTVLRNSDPVLGEPELTEAATATHALGVVVASLDAAAGGDGGDTGQALSQFDIGYVLLPAPVDQSLARQLDGAAGLVPLTKAPSYDLWQVAGTVARTWVIGAHGTVTPVPSGPVGVHAVVAAGTSGTLVLAEAAGGWSATLNGKPLASLAEPVDGWAQGFVLPAGGGRLVVTRDETAREISIGCEAAAVLVAFALAVPGSRSAVPDPGEEVVAGSDVETTRALGRRRDRASAPGPARRARRPHFAAAAVGAGAAAGPGRRQRGGQHAARHGKASRRWRASQAGGSVASASEVTRSPVVTDPDGSEAILDPSLENLDFVSADEDGDAPSQPIQDPAAAGPPPRQFGDRP